jgi:hypothetical protein
VADYSTFDPLDIGGGPGSIFPGLLYPPDGLVSPPPIDLTLSGVFRALGTKGMVWVVVVGSPAWIAWADALDADGKPTLEWGAGVVDHVGPIAPVTTVDYQPVEVAFGPWAPPDPPKDVNLPDVVNDPTTGPVIAGQPTDNGTLATLWRLPGSIVGKFLPTDRTLPKWLGLLLLALPFGLLFLLLFWLFRRFRK